MYTFRTYLLMWFNIGLYEILCRLIHMLSKIARISKIFRAWLFSCYSLRETFLELTLQNDAVCIHLDIVINVREIFVSEVIGMLSTIRTVKEVIYTIWNSIYILRSFSIYRVPLKKNNLLYISDTDK